MERRPGNSRFKVGGEERKKRGRGGERMGSGSSRYLDGMGLDWIVRRKYVLVPELVRAVNRCGSTHGVPLPIAAGLTVGGVLVLSLENEVPELYKYGYRY